MPPLISAVIVDTFPDKILPSIAIEKTLECPQVGKVYTFSDKPFFAGAEFIEIPEINDVEEYSKVVLYDLIKFVKEDFLIIQWDGYCLNPKKWNVDFQKFDYIGPPHFRGENYCVGNGGFSFRSLRLMHAIAEICKAPEGSEDYLITIEYKDALNAMGIQLAPLDLAQQFAYQEGPALVGKEDIFGFHGPSNLPKFISEETLLPLAENIIRRIHNFQLLTVYLESCKSHNKFQLFIESVHAINRQSKTMKMIDSFFAGRVSQYWAERFITVMS